MAEHVGLLPFEFLQKYARKLDGWSYLTEVATEHGLDCVFLARDEKRVLPDMGVRVRFLDDDAPAGIETGAVRDRIVVPKAAVRTDADGTYVWVARDDTAQRRPVKTGAETGDQIEITAGVNAGEKVVVRGAEKLAGDSAKVRLVE